MSDVGRACSAGTGCGGCRPEIASIVERERLPHAEHAHGFSLPVLQQVG